MVATYGSYMLAGKQKEKKNYICKPIVSSVATLTTRDGKVFHILMAVGKNEYLCASI